MTRAIIYALVRRSRECTGCTRVYVYVYTYIFRIAVDVASATPTVSHHRCSRSITHDEIDNTLFVVPRRRNFTDLYLLIDARASIYLSSSASGNNPERHIRAHNLRNNDWRRVKAGGGGEGSTDLRGSLFLIARLINREMGTDPRARKWAISIKVGRALEIHR